MNSRESPVSPRRAVVELDQVGRIRALSRQAAGALGRRPEEVIGRSVRDLLAEPAGDAVSALLSVLHSQAPTWLAIRLRGADRTQRCLLRAVPVRSAEQEPGLRLEFAIRQFGQGAPRGEGGD